FQGMSPNQYWSFVPNPAYNGTKTTLKKVVFDYESSVTSEFASLKNGQVNIGYIDPTMVGSQSQLSGVKLTPQYGWQFDYAQINETGKGPGATKYFNQPYVRQALQMGVDQLGMIKHLQHGYGVPTIETVPSQPPNTIYDKSLKNPWPYSPANGQKLLEQHGWKMQKGVLTKNGTKFAFTFVYVTGSPIVQYEAELLKQDWLK
ncbi:extracellular solute-binding protein family 5, partial [mine drainage metagenome]